MHFRRCPPGWNLAREGRAVQKHSPTLPRFEIRPYSPCTPHLTIPGTGTSCSLNLTLPSKPFFIFGVLTGTASPKTSRPLTGFNSEDISRFFYPILTWKQPSQRLFPKWGSEPFPPSLGPYLAFALLEGHYQATSRFVLGYNCSWIFVPCNQKGHRQKSSSWN